MQKNFLIFFTTLIAFMALTTGCATFPGFDFALQEDAFWEYNWDYEYQYFDANTTNITQESSKFRITLGEPTTINGIQSFPIIFSGNGNYVKDHCTHLAVQNDKIYCSPDGGSLINIFDADDGNMIGYGFFSTLNESALFEVQSGQISNDYIDTDAYVISQSSETSNCEYYPGIGNVCGSDYDETLIKREYYKENIGPIGAYHYTGFSGDSWFSNSTRNIGMVSSSLRGNSVDYDLEIEPNNYITNATKIFWHEPIVGQRPKMKGDNWDEDNFGGVRTFSFVEPTVEIEDNDIPDHGQYFTTLPIKVTGGIFQTDNSYSIDITGVPGLPNYRATFEDWYRIHLFDSKTIEIRLDFPPPNAYVKPDIDLFIMSIAGNSATIHDFSTLDNPANGTYSESITVTLNSGTYYIGIDLYELQGSSGSVAYTLNLKEAGQITEVEIIDIYEVDIPGDFTPPTWAEITGNPSIVIMDSNGPVGGYYNKDLIYGKRINLSIIRFGGHIRNKFYIGVTTQGTYSLELKGGIPPPITKTPL